MDPFILYGGTYKRLRESMSGAMNEKEIEELGEATQVLCNHFFYILLHSCQTCILYCVELETTRGGPFPDGSL